MTARSPRAVSLALLVVATGCVAREARTPAPTDTPPAPETAPPARDRDDAAPDPAADEAQASVTARADGRCEPTPKAGDPCRPGDGFCVLSWGEPGGWSTALWCRDGRWQIENERNLPE